MAFKIAYGAGHYLKTAGKRLPAQSDPAQTREWVLNDRVARYFAEAASEYEGVELLRVDDPKGTKNITLSKRIAAANKWGANFALAIHHNAGANLTKAGGIVAYSYRKSTQNSAAYRDAVYDACIAAGGLRGNRAEPKQGGGFDVLKYTKMPAVLMEYGFMDSKTDAPIILTDTYSKLVAYATMEGIARVAGLKKKVQLPADKPSDPVKTLESKKAKEYAKAFNKSLAGSYRVTASSLNVRHGAGVLKSVMVTVPKNTKVQCYGYYSTSLGAKWLYVAFEHKGVSYTGFCHSKYLARV